MATIIPFILGSGRTSDAIKKSLLILSLQNPEFKIAAPQQLERGVNLSDAIKQHCPNNESAILFLANPPALHAKAVLDASAAGFAAVVSEKPVCVNIEEAEQLRQVKIPVAVCHGYRQMWGIQTLKKLISSGEYGKLISIEGRYWSSSTAQVAVSGLKKPQAWKNNPAISGPFDAFLDIGTHWADMAVFLAEAPLKGGRVWLSYVNAEAEHRDSHAHLDLKFENGTRARSSISKNAHGYGNEFEVQVICERGLLSWNFRSPDQITIGRGIEVTTLTRSEAILGSRQPAFHAMGWLEGYVEIIRQLIHDVRGESHADYPNLGNVLPTMTALLNLEIERD